MQMVFQAAYFGFYGKARVDTELGTLSRYINVSISRPAGSSMQSKAAC